MTKRAKFATHLRDCLSPHGVMVLGANFGRDGASPTWVLTLQRPNEHVLTLNAHVDALDPFAMETAAEVASRVVRYLEARP